MKENLLNGVVELNKEVAKSEFEFLVFPKDGVVVCKIWNCRNIAIKRLKKSSFLLTFREESKYKIKDVYVGIARCNPEDDFDEATGKKIAMIRAKRARGSAVNTMIKKFIDKEQKKLRNLEKLRIHKLPDVSEVIGEIQKEGE